MIQKWLFGGISMEIKKKFSSFFWVAWGYVIHSISPLYQDQGSSFENWDGNLSAKCLRFIAASQNVRMLELRYFLTSVLSQNNTKY
jgi:hypothetical protein